MLWFFIGAFVGSFLWIEAFAAIARSLFKVPLIRSLWVGYAGSIAFALLSFLWSQSAAITVVLYALLGPLVIWLHRKRSEKRAAEAKGL